MNKFNPGRFTLSALVACASVATFAPASALPIGAWDFNSSDKYCTIGTNQNGGLLIMMVTKSGAHGMLVILADQASITVGQNYPLMISLAGSSDHAMSANADNFGGSKALIFDFNVVGIAAGEADGFAMRVKLNDVVIFNKDMHGSRDAFAAFVACSKALKK